MQQNWACATMQGIEIVATTNRSWVTKRKPNLYIKIAAIYTTYAAKPGGTAEDQSLAPEHIHDYSRIGSGVLFY